MKKTVFLDRDGTIIQEVDNLTSVRQLRLIPGAVKALQSFKQMGFLIIIITNQPVIARGWLNLPDLDYIHSVLLKRLSKKGAVVDAIYSCPHHPEANLKKYKKRCSCRKPGIGLIKKAAKDFPILFKKSFFIGDSTRDILAGKRAGLKTILLKTGYGGRDGKFKTKPDFIAKNLKEAAEIIKKRL